MSPIITILIVFLVAWACIWLVDYAGTPHPANVIVKVLIGALAILKILSVAGIIPAVI